VWSIAATGDGPGPLVDLVPPTIRVIAFAEDRDGELFILDYDDGSIHELMPSDAVAATATFPEKLSETGLFTDTAKHEPMPGVTPFEIAAEAWADHATSQRIIGLPGTGAVKLHPGKAPVAGVPGKELMGYRGRFLASSSGKGDAGTGTAASARKSLGIAEPKTVRAELDSLRAGQDRLTKENADLRQQANAAATQVAEGKRAAADAAALRSANDEQGRQISQLRKELEAARAMAAKAAAAPAVQTAAAPAAQVAAAPAAQVAAAPAAQVAAPAPVATAAAPSGPSAYWNGKEWPSDEELRHMMWKYYDTNKVDLEQPLAYKEAEKELRRRTGAK
jgi:hypothetical protein